MKPLFRAGAPLFCALTIALAMPATINAQSGTDITLKNIVEIAGGGSSQSALNRTKGSGVDVSAGFGSVLSYREDLFATAIFTLGYRQNSGEYSMPVQNKLNPYGKYEFSTLVVSLPIYMHYRPFSRAGFFIKNADATLSATPAVYLNPRLKAESDITFRSESGENPAGEEIATQYTVVSRQAQAYNMVRVGLELGTGLGYTFHLAEGKSKLRIGYHSWFQVANRFEIKDKTELNNVTQSGLGPVNYSGAGNTAFSLNAGHFNIQYMW